MTETTSANALFGEIISIGVAFSWTLAALSSEIGSKHLGVIVMNVWRMSLALIFSILLCFLLLGSPYPIYASTQTWGWLLLSGIVGYFFGDWCLFNSYLYRLTLRTIIYDPCSNVYGICSLGHPRADTFMESNTCHDNYINRYCHQYSRTW